mmetsp:Transcript_12230/g.35384  ORF Transcript_12230/g.35384 Transcript_12230/m.35384 type:complete len:268 (-) Transcript_12230:618-1421(-)
MLRRNRHSGPFVSSQTPVRGSAAPEAHGSSGQQATAAAAVRRSAVSAVQVHGHGDGEQGCFPGHGGGCRAEASSRNGPRRGLRQLLDLLASTRNCTGRICHSCWSGFQIFLDGSRRYPILVVDDSDVKWPILRQLSDPSGVNRHVAVGWTVCCQPLQRSLDHFPAAQERHPTPSPSLHTSALPAQDHEQDIPGEERKHIVNLRHGSGPVHKGDMALEHHDVLSQRRTALLVNMRRRRWQCVGLPPQGRTVLLVNRRRRRWRRLWRRR